MEITKGSLVRCKFTHCFFLVETVQPAREERHYGQTRKIPGSLRARCGAWKRLDDVVRVA